MNTFFQLCIYITLFLLIFSLTANFVYGLGIFDVGVQTGFQSEGTANATFTNLTNVTNIETGETGGMGLLWQLVLGGGIGAIVVAGITRSPAMIGAWIFGSVFWISYGNMIFALNLDTYIPAGFLLIGTAAMFFIFAGAIAGMLSGAG